MEMTRTTIEEYEAEIRQWRSEGLSLRGIERNLRELGIVTDRFRIDRYCRKHDIPAPRKPVAMPDAAPDRLSEAVDKAFAAPAPAIDPVKMPAKRPSQVVVASTNPPPVRAPMPAPVAVVEVPKSVPVSATTACPTPQATPVRAPMTAPLVVVEAPKPATVSAATASPTPQAPPVRSVERDKGGGHADITGPAMPAPRPVSPVVAIAVASAPVQPPGVRFPQIHRHRDTVMLHVKAGSDALLISVVLTHMFQTPCTAEQVQAYVAGTLDQEYPVGTIRPDLRSIAPPGRTWSDETKILGFETGDAVTLKQLYGGAMVFGAPGSSKTSGSGRGALFELLRQGAAVVALTSKVGETDELRIVASMAGRGDSTQVISPSGFLRFNVLEYERRWAQNGMELTENLVHCVKTIGSMARGRFSSTGAEGFWESSGDLHLRGCFDLFRLAGVPVDLERLGKLTSSAPQSLAAAAEPGWRDLPFFGELLAAADRNTQQRPSERRVYENVKEYWLQSFSGLAPNTRSCIVHWLMGLISAFRQPGIYELFSTHTTWTPESAISNGSVTIVDMPLNRDGEAGRMAQGLIKYETQKAMLRRADAGAGKGPGMRPLVIYADEAHGHLSSFDADFLRLARETRCVSFYMTQSVSNLYETFGGDRAAEAKTHAILGALNTKIFHANGDQTTNEYASELIGTEQKTVTETSKTPSQYGGFDPLKRFLHRITSQPSVTTSGKTIREAIIQPCEFSDLQPGGPEHDWVAEAVLTQVGRTFSNGKRFLKVGFKQLLLPSFEEYLAQVRKATSVG